MAEIEILLPKMGESVAEATIVKWLKNEGDAIELDESIVEIATDKVDSEVPCGLNRLRGRRFYNLLYCCFGRFYNGMFNCITPIR